MISKDSTCFSCLPLPKAINLAEIERFINDNATKRIHFTTQHSAAIHKGIALCMHEYVSDDRKTQRSVLGEHEYQLKYNSANTIPQAI